LRFAPLSGATLFPAEHPGAGSNAAERALRLDFWAKVRIFSASRHPPAVNVDFKPAMVRACDIAVNAEPAPVADPRGRLATPCLLLSLLLTGPWAA